MHELRPEADVSPLMIGIVTLLYAATAINEAWQGGYPLAIFLGGCSVANVGIMMMAKG